MKQLTTGLFLCLISVVASAQNVGIGIPAPLGKLHIKGASDVSQLIIDGNSLQSNSSPLFKLRKSSGTDLLWINADTSLNTFVGLFAGRVNNANGGGVFNTYTGSHSGYYSATGNSNSGFGANSLFMNATGNFNSAHGLNALFSNASGSWNTAIGANALFSNNAGNSNVAVGNTALLSNTNGSSNTANGTDAMKQNTSGSNNTASGFKALLNNTSGTNNTAIGNETLNTITTGSNNTALGYGANVSTAAITNATAIGAKAYAGSNNSVVIGSINGINGATSNTNVGIGITTPHSSAAFEVKSTDKGVLVPRIALTAANSASPVTAPANALLVYNTATAGSGTNAVEPGFYYWNASASRWNTMSRSHPNGSSGFGSWGDCSSNSVSDYNPVADETGESSDKFGISVSISGSYAIIGAQQDNETFGSQGSASIYQYNGSNWDFMQKLTDVPGEPSAYFGCSVSLSGDYAIVGAIYDGPLNEGSASIYHYNGTNWVLMQKVMDTNPILQGYFGVSVSISGTKAIVGAYRDDVGAGPTQGSASIYQLNGTSWILMQEISDATGVPDDWFGGSVSISDTYVIVGAALDDVGANINQGSASIYQYNGTNWVLMQKITDATGAASDLFGSSVSISGDYVIVGSHRDDVGSNTDQGSASIFKYDGTNWTLMQKLVDPNGATEDYFGYSVAISGNHAMVGAIWDDIVSNSNQGSATIYQKVGIGWQKLQYLTDPAGSQQNFFGVSSAIDINTNRFVVGASGFMGGAGKVVFGKTN